MGKYINFFLTTYFFTIISLVADEGNVVKVPITSLIQIKKNLLLVEPNPKEKLNKFILSVWELNSDEKKEFMVCLDSDISRWKKEIHFPPSKVENDKVKILVAQAKEYIKNDKEASDKLDGIIKSFNLLENHKRDESYYCETRTEDENNFYLYLYYPDKNIIIYMATENNSSLSNKLLYIPLPFDLKVKKTLLDVKSEKDFFGDGSEIMFYELDKKEVENLVNIIKKQENKFWKYSKVYPEKDINLNWLTSDFDFLKRMAEKDKAEALDVLIKKYKLLEGHPIEKGYYYEKRHLGGVSDMSLYILLPDENILICLIATT